MFSHCGSFEPVPNSFPGGHAQYLKVWEKLFLYETYNVLVNSKRSSEDKRGECERRRGGKNESYSWIGYLIRSNEDRNFVNARLYDYKPTVVKEASDHRNEEEKYSPIKSVKESDILLLSTEDLSQGRGDRFDIKRKVTAEWLKSVLLKENTMFAYVNERSKRGSTYVEVKIDLSKYQFLKDQQDLEQGFIKMYCYPYESLSTCIREYKTLRMSEFYGFSQTLLEPQRSLSELKSNH